MGPLQQLMQQQGLFNPDLNPIGPARDPRYQLLLRLIREQSGQFPAVGGIPGVNGTMVPNEGSGYPTEPASYPLVLGARG